MTTTLLRLHLRIPPAADRPYPVPVRDWDGAVPVLAWGTGGGVAEVARAELLAMAAVRAAIEGRDERAAEWLAAYWEGQQERSE